MDKYFDAKLRYLAVYDIKTASYILLTFCLISLCLFFHLQSLYSFFYFFGRNWKCYVLYKESSLLISDMHGNSRSTVCFNGCFMWSGPLNEQCSAVGTVLGKGTIFAASLPFLLPKLVLDYFSIFTNKNAILQNTNTKQKLQTTFRLR